MFEFQDVNIIHVILRTTMALIVTHIFTRLLGKKQISQLTFFNYVTGITVGSISANIVSMESEPFIDEFIGLITWCLLTYLISYINVKSHKIRLLIDGKPILVINKGDILKKELSRVNLSIDDLLMLLREENIFSITEVDYAILETNGKLSVLKKIQNQEVIKSDMQIKSPTPKNMPTQIILEGKLLNEKLKFLNISTQWIESELRAQNIHSLKDVFYGEVQSNGTLYVRTY